MKPGRIIPIICTALMLGALPACNISRTAATPITHYTLEYESPKMEKAEVLPYVIMIKRFSVSPDYNMLPIIYRDKAFVRNTYSYHRWRANPGDLVTYYLARDFKAQSAFTAVLSYDSNLRMTHTLEGVVEEFYERDGEDSWEAVLGFSVTLVKMHEPDVTRQIVFQKQYRLTQKADEKNPESIAKAMSQAMEKASLMVMEDVYAALEAADRK
ncbi:ABC-type transport auxiliary lipoprotein family protein [Desulfatibacillum aliphaticivorans]|uniref:ABC-type transport auxiliary lipoprotein family protein n=1 Tax=Desulfatibacillum aliphaticivorans TaxID=218208 RepID=UPI000423A162|nr:ABC-type transport auxiliary lipoprotein family protein [Desulfatibacillum aliphaticivorans]